MSDLVSWLRLSSTPRVGSVTFKQLLDYYGSASEALLHIGDLSKRGGARKPLLPPSRESIEQQIDYCQSENIRIICQYEDAYPALLKQIDDAPLVLYVKGNSFKSEQQTVGIVGSRNASASGQVFTQKLAAALGQQNVIIVSGLARGIDTAAHKGSLETGTIAVLGGGIDHIYPPENKDLYDAIIESGCIISEYPPGMVPRAQHFPRRNRIISGLSRAVIVIEAAKRSGSLITARTAGEQGRDVLAVPGSPVDSRCHGSNGLIKNGAALVEDASDVMAVLNNSFEPLQNQTFNLNEQDSFYQPMSKQYEESEVEQWRSIVVNALSPTPVAKTDLQEITEVPATVLHLILLELQLAERLEWHPGDRVSLIY